MRPLCRFFSVYAGGLGKSTKALWFTGLSAGKARIPKRRASRRPAHQRIRIKESAQQKRSARTVRGRFSLTFLCLELCLAGILYFAAGRWMRAVDQPRFSASLTLAMMCWPMSREASTVCAPRWGVTMKLSHSNRGESKPAPSVRPPAASSFSITSVA